MPIVKGFRRFHSNIVSSRQVATEISNLVSGSNIKISERSSASLTSEKPIRKRVNNAERREMLESFVNKYRAMNMGKFPSTTSAQKEVGGGYYSIKKMLQEMEYNFKMSSGSQQKANDPINPSKENKRQIEGENALSQKITMESSGSQEKSKGPVNPTKKNKKQIKGVDALNQEVAMEASRSQEKSNGPIDPIKENKEQIEGDNATSQEISSGSQEKSNAPIDQNLCEDPLFKSGSNFDKYTDTGNSKITKDVTSHNITSESDEKPEQNPRDDNSVFKDSESKVKTQPDMIINITRDKGEKENELKETASLWGNLKSLANEFISMWKK